MTITELKELENMSEEEYMDIISRLDSKYGHVIPKLAKMSSEDSLEFWSNVLDNVTDKETQKMLYVIINEASCTTPISLYWDDLDELYKAFEDDRCFVFPFKPGDYIQANGKNPQKVTSIELNHAYTYPIVNVEYNIPVHDVMTINEQIEYPRIEEYAVVAPPPMAEWEWEWE